MNKALRGDETESVTKEKALGGNHSGNKPIKSTLRSSIWKVSHSSPSNSPKTLSDGKKSRKDISVDEFGVQIQAVFNDRPSTGTKRTSSIQQFKKNIVESSLPKYRPKFAAGNEKNVQVQIAEKTTEKDTVSRSLPRTPIRQDSGKNFRKSNEVERKSARSVDKKYDKDLKTACSSAAESKQSSCITAQSPVDSCADTASPEQLFHEPDSMSFDLDDVESLLGDVVPPTIPTPAPPKSKFKLQSNSRQLAQQISRLPKLSQGLRNLSCSKQDAELLSPDFPKKLQSSLNLYGSYDSQLHGMLYEEQFNALPPFPLTPSSSASALNDEYFISPFSALSQAKKFTSISRTLLPDPIHSPTLYATSKEFDLNPDTRTLKFEHAHFDEFSSEKETDNQISEGKLEETREEEFWKGVPKSDHTHSEAECHSEGISHTQANRSIPRSALNDEENLFLYKETIRRRLYSNIINVRGHWLHASNTAKRDVEMLQMGRHLISNMLQTLDFLDCIVE